MDIVSFPLNRENPGDCLSEFRKMKINSMF